MNEIIKKNGITFGIILGIIGVFSNLTVYLLGGISKDNLLISSSIQILFWLAYLITRIIQCNNTKKQMNGFVTFKELFTTLTITILIGILVSQLFTFLLNNYIDVEYGKMMNEFMNEKQVEAKIAMKSFTRVTSQDIEEIKKTDNFSLKNITQGSLATFLISSVMNLILAAIFKSKTPEYQ
jgi:hypothetical protein